MAQKLLNRSDLRGVVQMPQSITVCHGLPGRCRGSTTGSKDEPSGSASWPSRDVLQEEIRSLSLSLSLVLVPESMCKNEYTHGDRCNTY